MKTHGSRVTRGHGMRSGISLIELLMAIVLLGILSTIGYKYYKIYYDTTFAAKQAKIYVLIDQAQQLSGAHDLYETKNGYVPNRISTMVTDRELIAIPPVMPTVSSTGWRLFTPGKDGNGTDVNATIDLDGSGGFNDIIFMIRVDPTTGINQDKLDFCNIVSNTGLNTWNLSTAVGDVIKGADINASIKAGYTDATSASPTVSSDMYCTNIGDGTAYDFNLVFVKKVNK